ncbi:MAG: group 1 glycosyl transferase [Candidatus Berkelbacteria bacterium Licking1014_7]|uniref:Group 1 glycosyl transferase n=1 Tax=Candidatus Berkelbacteria bacterium Licking1014_7 TaxID=2017147 RepID=A0A554LKX6_9BACT|nr:MAG: group 1 glycosyl transferase [Candidatus Berkelbacteria bacterium Licking1014_7]
MKIGIDIQTTLGQKTGFGFYVENLVAELKKIDRKNEYVYFAPKKESDLSMPGRFYWDQFSISYRARQAKVDIFHQPSFSLPLLFPGKVIATVHDLIAVLFAEHIPFFSRQFFGHWMPFTYHKADHIMCISEHTKKDLVKIIGVPEEKISVVYLAASEDYKPAKSVKMPPARLGITQPYFLHVGTLNPRKNLAFLIDVFFAIARKYPNYQLVFTGKRGWYFEELFEQVKKLGLQKSIIFTDYLTEAEKIQLYQASFGFLFPSIYEGFGLPPLEAMKCGIPVIASNASSIPEVVGDAGILLPPDDKIEWVKAISNLIQRHNLRQTMMIKGFQQAQKFSWRRNASETLEIYEKVYRSNNQKNQKDEKTFKIKW